MDFFRAVAKRGQNGKSCLILLGLGFVGIL